MRRILITTAALGVALVLGGCSAQGDSAITEGSGGSAPIPAPADDSLGSRDDGSLSAPDAAVDPAKAAETDRSVITTGYMTVTVDNPNTAASDAARIATEAGGRVDARQEYAAADDRPSSAVLTLRIPAERLESALDDLRELGRVDEITQSASDVTVQKADLDARISALRTTIDRFNALVTSAATVEDLIKLESAISERQAELESLEAQQRGLNDQVSMSTLTVTLLSTSVAPARTPDTFVDGWLTGWNAFLAFWAAILVGIGVLLPWLISGGIIALIVIFIVRTARRRTPKTPLQPPTPPAGPPAPPLAA